MDSLKKRSGKPVIAISSGDPSGIGPEIIVKALDNQDIYKECNPLVVSDAQVIRQVLDLCHMPQRINIMKDPSEGIYQYGTVDVLDLKNVDMNRFEYGKVSGMSGKASFEYIYKVIDLALKNKASATVTGPINKRALQLAGIKFAGHTEIFAHYTGSSNYAMMLADGNFRVVHVNTHVSMLEAIKRINKERILNTILLAHEALKKMGIENPRIAVSGLNPHAGENGLFGSEELEHIIPAVGEARKQGIDADGPHPPDTIFPKMRGGLYDAVVCMYHDQGHIPVKLLGFQYDEKQRTFKNISGVNITLGLPIIRVSVDHGTAFEIAGKGVANPESMIQAITYAVKLSKK
jgi:4-hydroxythreonine-4-phosphate dehydrogenase